MVRPLRAWLIFFLAVLCFPAGADANTHQATQGAHAEMALIGIVDLPSEGRDTLRLIRQGGPFPYSRDGGVFGNYERILPKQARGYYHEYTVKTPGARNRGARRIVCGPLPECYYTADHYKNFKRIRE